MRARMWMSMNDRGREFHGRNPRKYREGDVDLKSFSRITPLLFECLSVFFFTKSKTVELNGMIERTIQVQVIIWFIIAIAISFAFHIGNERDHYS